MAAWCKTTGMQTVMMTAPNTTSTSPKCAKGSSSVMSHTFVRFRWSAKLYVEAPLSAPKEIVVVTSQVLKASCHSTSNPYLKIRRNCVRIVMLHRMDYRRTPLIASTAPWQDIWHFGKYGSSKAILRDTFFCFHYLWSINIAHISLSVSLFITPDILFLPITS